MLFQTNPENIHVLNPLFWHRGDCHAAIEEEMRRMKEVGINDFVVEPRPHPDYLGPRWWQDLDFILEQAEKLNMIVWLFDDGDYPSGVANGELAEKYPQHTKRYWLENHMGRFLSCPMPIFSLTTGSGKGRASIGSWPPGARIGRKPWAEPGLLGGPDASGFRWPAVLARAGGGMARLRH